MAVDLSQLRLKAEALPAGDPERAPAWLAFAEATPSFRHHGADVREALDLAGAELATSELPALDARLALRRAELALAEERPEDAAAAATLAAAAADRAGDATLRFTADVLFSRAEQRTPASAGVSPGTGADTAGMLLEDVVTRIAEHVDAGAQGDVATARLALHLALATAESHLVNLRLEEAERTFGEAEQHLRWLGAGELPDLRFAILQGLVLVAQLGRKFGRAADRLRQLVRLTSQHDAARDELDARLALGQALGLLGKHTEAQRHLARCRMLARGTADDDVDVRLLTLSSSALTALGAGDGKAALDHAYQALDLAGREKKTVTSFVGAVSLIANIHLAQQNRSEAYLALAYGASSLKQRFGVRAAALLQVQIDELRQSMGEARFEAMCADILKARAARRELEPG